MAPPTTGAAQYPSPAGNYLTLTLARGPLISQSAALSIGEPLLRDKWDEEHARLQGKLVAEDQGDTWRVLGQPQSDPFGQFCLIIRKSDGLVLNIGIFGGPGWASLYQAPLITTHGQDSRMRR